MTTHTIGTNLRKKRLEKGHKNYARFAKENNISRTTYLGWEKGQNMTLKNLFKVCEALKIEPVELFV